jgi:hypothetical protein
MPPGTDACRGGGERYAGLFNLSFAGIPFVCFGLAVARAGTYPRWLGWVAF